VGGQGGRVWGRGVAKGEWERLVRRESLIPQLQRLCLLAQSTGLKSITLTPATRSGTDAACERRGGSGCSRDGQEGGEGPDVEG